MFSRTDKGGQEVDASRLATAEALLADLRLEMDRRFANQDRITNLALDSVKNTIDIAQGTANRAVLKAEAAAERAYLEAQIESLRRAIDAQIDAQKEAIQAALVATKEALSAAQSSSNLAVRKAEEANEKRFEGVNEFRAQLSDQQRTLVTKSEVDYRFTAMEKMIETINQRQHATDLKFPDYLTVAESDRHEAEIATWRRLVDAQLTAAQSKSSLIASIIAVAISSGVLLIAIYNLFSKMPAVPRL
jgi:hypothetical protein